MSATRLRLRIEIIAYSAPHPWQVAVGLECPAPFARSGTRRRLLVGLAIARCREASPARAQQIPRLFTRARLVLSPECFTRALLDYSLGSWPRSWGPSRHAYDRRPHDIAGFHCFPPDMNAAFQLIRQRTIGLLLQDALT